MITIHYTSPQAKISKVKGVEKTIVGYCGGTRSSPSYRSMKDYTESIRIEYNPTVITFEKLVTIWAQLHSPTRQTSRQYRSALFYSNEEERKIGLEAIEKMKKDKLGGKQTTIYSNVEPLSGTKFYKAEEYHQDYLKKKGIVRY